MPVRRLTDVTLTKLRAPEKTGASIDYFDAGQAALALRVGRQSRSWTVFARLNGRLRRVTLGHYPTMGLAEARQKATELVAAFREGHDPTLERKQNTVEAVVADWLADDQAKNRTVLGVTRLMAKDVLPTLGRAPDRFGHAARSEGSREGGRRARRPDPGSAASRLSSAPLYLGRGRGDRHREPGPRHLSAGRGDRARPHLIERRASRRVARGGRAGPWPVRPDRETPDLDRRAPERNRRGPLVGS